MKYSYNDIMMPWYPEEFKNITMPPIKEDMYAVSNYGNIINIKTGKLLSKLTSRNGYYETALQNEDNTRSIYKNHILVAYHFIPKTEDDIINNRNMVNHKNLLRYQNYVHNLEWVNSQENNAHAREFNHLKIIPIVERYNDSTWGNSNTSGSKNGMARLTEEQVHTICKMLEDGYSYKDICISIGLQGNDNDKHIITNIIAGKRWKEISKNYNLPKPRVCTDFSQYIVPVCELIEEGYSTTEIIKKLNMDNTKNRSSQFINRLKRKEIYPDIIKNYNF